MKKQIVTGIMVGLMIVLMLSACGQITDSEVVPSKEGNGTVEISESAEEVWEEQEVQEAQEVQEGQEAQEEQEDDSIALETDLAEDLKEEEQPVSEEGKTDFYEGEYSSYDIDEPALEIKKNDDETYQIQINLYRLFYLDDGIGRVTEEGLAFTATGPGAEEAEVTGVIQIKEDIATVIFFGQEWLDFAGASEYEFYKTSDVPNR